MKSKNINIEVNKATNFKDPQKIIAALRYAFEIPLTEKEIRVLSLWLRSLRAKEIALILNKSHRTVEGQLSSIKTKIGFNRSIEVIDYLKSKQAFSNSR